MKKTAGDGSGDSGNTRAMTAVAFKNGLFTAHRRKKNEVISLNGGLMVLGTLFVSFRITCRGKREVFDIGTIIDSDPIST